MLIEFPLRRHTSRLSPFVVALLVLVAGTAEAHTTAAPTSDPVVSGPAEPGASARAKVPRAFRGLFEPEATLPAPRSGPETIVPRPTPFSDAAARAAAAPASERSIAWRSLLRQSVVFLLVQQAWRVTFEEGTRAQLGGPFFEEWIDSAGTLCCWDDGDKFSTNYLFHPLMGSTTSFIFANNHRASQDTPIGASGRYWKAKGAQGIYSLIYAVNFELGPLSESSIGNVGMTPGQQTFVDIVVTPGLGLLLSVGEDAARRHIIDRVMRKNRYWGNTLALVLNPTRSVANAMAWKSPWRGPDWSYGRRPQ